MILVLPSRIRKMNLVASVYLLVWLAVIHRVTMLPEAITRITTVATTTQGHHDTSVKLFDLSGLSYCLDALCKFSITSLPERHKKLTIQL